MNDKDLLQALRRLKVETGSLACMGCGYEHNCGVHGCAIRFRGGLQPGFELRCDLVKHGRITAVNEEAEKALEAMKDA